MNRLVRRVQHYLGMDLPRRRLDLNFACPQPSRRGGRPPMSKGGLRRRMSRQGGGPPALLRSLLTLQRDLNRYPMTASKRVRLSLVLLSAWLPLAQRLIHQYSDKGGIPDSEDRREQLDLAAEVARSLAVSLQLALQADYDRSRFSYARVRDRIYTCAFRVLELIRWEQRLCGLRYRGLSPRAWQDAHTVYQIMQAYESVDYPLPLLENLLAENRVRKVASLHDVYASIQVFSILDFSKWPVRYQSFIDTYLGLVDQAVTVSPAEVGVGEDTYIAYCYQDRPPFIDGSLPGQGPAVLINCAVLFDNIRADFKDLLKAEREGNLFLVPQKLAPLQADYRFFLLRLILQNMRSDNWLEQTGQLADRAPGLRIYSGVRDIYAHLNALFHGSAFVRDARSLTDTLAQRSALIGEDHSSEALSQWYVLERTAQRLRLRTQETSYNVPMHIGSLVAYGFDEDEIQRPCLASVTRILRTDARTVVVDLDHIVGYGEPVSLRKCSSSDEMSEGADTSTPIGAFLVHDQERGWGLLVPAAVRLGEGAQVSMKRGRKKLRLRLGAIRIVSVRLMLYRLEGQEKGLGEALYPCQRKAPAEPPSAEPTVLELPDLMSSGSG